MQCLWGGSCAVILCGPDDAGQFSTNHRIAAATTTSNQQPSTMAPHMKLETVCHNLNRALAYVRTFLLLCGVQLQIPERLASRQQCSVVEFDAAMASLRTAYNSAPYTPGYGDVQVLQPGTVHLTSIDEGFKRHYSRQ